MITIVFYLNLFLALRRGISIKVFTLHLNDTNVLPLLLPDAVFHSRVYDRAGAFQILFLNNNNSSNTNDFFFLLAIIAAIIICTKWFLRSLCLLYTIAAVLKNVN